MRNSKLSPRRISRSLAVQGIYHFQTNPKSVSEIEDYLQNSNDELFAKANYELLHFLLDMVTTNFAASLDLYSNYSSREINDIQPIEKSVLAIAAIELKNSISVPAPVIINEAIELAKLYGGEDSFKFVNGLVDKLANELRKTEMEHFRNKPRVKSVK